jgi:hypothetical protein
VVAQHVQDGLHRGIQDLRQASQLRL